MISKINIKHNKQDNYQLTKHNKIIFVGIVTLYLKSNINTLWYVVTIRS